MFGYVRVSSVHWLSPNAIGVSTVSFACSLLTGSLLNRIVLEFNFNICDAHTCSKGKKGALISLIFEPAAAGLPAPAGHRRLVGR